MPESPDQIPQSFPNTISTNMVVDGIKIKMGQKHKDWPKNRFKAMNRLTQLMV